MTAWYALFYYAAVVAVLVRSITKEEITREPRRWLSDFAHDRRHNRVLRKLAYMPTCEFCCSFWVTLILLAGVFQFGLIFDDWRGYFVSIFTVMAVANVYMSLFDYLRVDLRKERAVAENDESRQAA